ncbi:hypothetical protein NQ317_015903 [Molorchus minor]|uniref:Uncharacterized protein n=1 Tax=Molorchus minor TaxID=1323400 RepID=A0ABQ9JCG2_9CUCU|nr:hypothetical protein NQ317_015903 [Molorchus minor]
MYMELPKSKGSSSKPYGGAMQGEIYERVRARTIMNVFQMFWLPSKKTFLYNIYGYFQNVQQRNKTEVPYAFKAFQYERIIPNPSSRIPFPRSGHRIGADSSNFYSFGGYNPLVRDEVEHHEDDEFWVQSYPLFQELWKFNFA